MRGIDDADDPTIYFQIPNPGDTWEEDQLEQDPGMVFHRENPHVYQQLRALALGLVDAGQTHYSIKGLFEVLRYDAALRTNGTPYKLNNNLTAFYARLLMLREPRLDGFFYLRSRRVR
tara:strand:+ start:111 stop:464 length:354 start_codon:yes stop_codon:yes gene_type:complete